MKKVRNNGPVSTVCYGKREEWKTRKQALDHFYECIANSFGAERERYVRVQIELIEGKKVATDGQPESTPEGCKSLSKEDLASIAEVEAVKDRLGDELDEIRAEIERRREEFERSISDLLAKEESVRESLSRVTTELIVINRLLHIFRDAESK